jgi:hypothetical protein
LDLSGYEALRIDGAKYLGTSWQFSKNQNIFERQEYGGKFDNFTF